LPVRGFRDHVQQRRELDDLAIGPAGDVRRLLEAGACVLADQLDAVGELGLLGRRAVGGRRLVGYRKDFCSLFVGR
jgi:hypothetical protein